LTVCETVFFLFPFSVFHILVESKSGKRKPPSYTETDLEQKRQFYGNRLQLFIFEVELNFSFLTILITLWLCVGVKISSLIRLNFVWIQLGNEHCFSSEISKLKNYFYCGNFYSKWWVLSLSWKLIFLEFINDWN
jgi:hypothetical protein